MEKSSRGQLQWGRPSLGKRLRGGLDSFCESEWLGRMVDSLGGGFSFGEGDLGITTKRFPGEAKRGRGFRSWRISFSSGYNVNRKKKIDVVIYFGVCTLVGR